MIDRRPPASTKRSADSTFGPMEPAGNCPAARWARISSALASRSALGRPTEVDADLVDPGDQHHRVDPGLGGEQGRGPVLVDDRVHGHPLPVPEYQRDAPPPAAITTAPRR